MNSGELVVTARNIANYSIDGDATKVVQVGEKDIDIVFEYKSLQAKVTIEKIFRSKDGTEQIDSEEKDAIFGQPFSYNAPYVKGWNLIGNSTIGLIPVVDEVNNKITFEYKEEEGNIRIILEEVEINQETGEEILTEIKELSDIITDGDGEKEIAIPDLTNDFYKLEDGQIPKKLEFEEETQEVHYRYIKEKRQVKIEGYDKETDSLIDSFDVLELYRVGEVYHILSKDIEGYEVVGDKGRNIIIESGTEAQVVRFDYRNIAETSVTVKYVTDSGKTLDTKIIKGLKIGKEYLHKDYPKQLKDAAGKLYSIVKFDKDKLVVDEDPNKNILIFVYSERKADPEPPTPPQPPVLPSEFQYTIRHIYKDKDAKIVDIIAKEVKSVPMGQKVKISASDKIDPKKFKLISDPVIEIELNAFTNTIVFEYEKLSDGDKDKGKLNKKDHIQYIEGYKDGSVRPNANIAREEAAAIVYRILDADYRESIKSTTHNFKDLSKTRWSVKHISTLVKGNVLEGYPSGTFRATNGMTRAEVATMLARLSDTSPKGSSKFKDVKGHWAQDAIGYAFEQGWIQGYKDGSFRPDAKITRAEFIIMINNMLDRKVDLPNMLDGRKEFKDLKKGQWNYNQIQEAVNGHEYTKDKNGIEKWTKLKKFEMDF